MISGSIGKISIERHQQQIHIACVDDLHGASVFIYPDQIDEIIDQLQAARKGIIADYPYLAGAK